MQVPKMNKRPRTSSKFLDPYAHELHKRQMNEKGLVPKKSINASGELMASIRSIILQKPWDTLTVVSKPTVTLLVREFYPNIREAFSYSMVRGKNIKMNFPTINAFYELLNIENCEYVQFLGNTIDFQEFISTRCLHRAKLIVMSEASYRFKLNM